MWYPHFFHQNDRKGCRIDHLDGLGHFLFWFWGGRENPGGVVTTALVRRGLKLIEVMYLLYSFRLVGIYVRRR